MTAPLCLAACSDEAAPPPLEGTPAPTPRLATAKPEQGEHVFRGDLTPRSHGPVELRGRYLVRFRQWAPEDVDRDFANETSFVAFLAGTAGAEPRRVPLFRESAAKGRRTIGVDGSYRLEVTFGDFPYVVRLTPRD